jgi:hypothetical protein
VEHTVDDLSLRPPVPHRSIEPGPTPSGFYSTTIVSSVPTPGETDLQLNSALDVNLRSVRGTPPECDPVFTDRLAKTMLGLLLRRRRPGTDLDVERVVRSLASGDVANALFMRQRWTLGGGAQLLIERSTAMNVFEADAKQLSRVLLRVMPHATVTRLRPSGGRRLPLPKPNIPTTRVLAFTDLGIGSPGFGSASRPASDWGRYEHTVRRSGGTVIALVPYPAADHPASVGRLSTVHWSDGLTTRASSRAAPSRS